MNLNVLFELGPNLTILGGKLVASLTDFTAKITEIQTTADAIKTAVDALMARLAAGGLTAEEEAQIFNQIETLKTHQDAAAAAAGVTPSPSPVPTPAP